MRGFSSTFDDCKLLQSIPYTSNKNLFEVITTGFTTSAVDTSFYVMIYG